MALNIRDAVRKYGSEYLAVCGLAHYFPVMNAMSHVFFVDGSQGNDAAANYGQTPDTPLLTITKALSLCVSGMNDYVFVMDYPEPAPLTEVFPLLIDKQRLHVIGLQNGLLPRFKICVPSTATASDKAVFTIRQSPVADDGSYTWGSYSEIANLIMGNKWDSSTRGTIECNFGGVFGLHIHHCHFGLAERSKTGGAWGIVIGKTLHPDDAAGELMHSLIEHCRFDTLLTSGGIYVPDGIYSGSNSVNGTVIRNNRFYVNNGDIGIHVADTNADFKSGGIYNNIFDIYDGADGQAITFASGAKGAVDGNRAWKNDSAIPTNTPFVDGGTGMGWGLNSRGGGEATETPYLDAPA